MNVSSSASLLVALTGGIATGKSAVAELFTQHGVPVLDTDQIARELVEPGTPIFGRVVEAFGAGMLDAAGRLDRARMRERVFADSTQRHLLESILHPAIRDELARRAAAVDGGYQIHMVPLLLETGRIDAYDRVLVVDCPQEQQISRLLARDGLDLELARRILAAQASREARLSAADDVIVNTGTLEELGQFVLTLHRNYERLAKNR